MDYLPILLKRFNLDLQPTNSDCINIESAKTVLYPGAHIATSNPYEHYHHGIVVDISESDITIIHLWGPDKKDSRIQTTTLPIFLAGGIHNLGKKTRRLYVVNYDGDNLEKQQQTIKAANEMIEKADEIVYDLATLNCESFACYCRTGKWHSEQVARVKNLVIQNGLKIYEQVKGADKANRKNIYSILKTISTDDLQQSEKELYEQLCQDCADELT